MGASCNRIGSRGGLFSESRTTAATFQRAIVMGKIQDFSAIPFYGNWPGTKCLRQGRAEWDGPPSERVLPSVLSNKWCRGRIQLQEREVDKGHQREEALEAGGEVRANPGEARAGVEVSVRVGTACARTVGKKHPTSEALLVLKKNVPSAEPP
jgi:hypothetical protein